MTLIVPLLLMLLAPPSSPIAGEMQAFQLVCSGCGCKGGPGWRSHRTGKCVSWKTLARECGSPPDPERCTKEN